MTPNQILDEFKRKYEGTYVFVQMPDSKEENLFHLASISSRGDGTGTMRLESEEFGKITLNTATAHTIKFAFPSVGVFQYGAHAYQFLRKPDRQWQRGLCNGNCRIADVTWMIDPLGRLPQSVDLSFGLVQAAFTKTVYSWAEAARMLATGRFRSVALEDGFALALSPAANPGYVLLYGASPVATVSTLGVVNVLETAFELQIRKVRA